MTLRPPDDVSGRDGMHSFTHDLRSFPRFPLVAIITNQPIRTEGLCASDDGNFARLLASFARSLVERITYWDILWILYTTSILLCGYNAFYADFLVGRPRN